MERLSLFFGFYLIIAALVGEAKLQFCHSPAHKGWRGRSWEHMWPEPAGHVLSDGRKLL